MIPRATYRLQFHKDFPFAAAIELAPYLAKLGISHVYSSPILTARAGSMHGYDVVDHTEINPEIGGQDGFEQMAAALRAAGLGIIIDIVPNHMAVGGGDNSWWLDVLENGRTSRYARFFDIDFDSTIAHLTGKILAPFLGETYEDALKSGELKVVRDEASKKVAVAYHHHRFPIRPQDRNAVSADLSRYDDPEALHALLEKQNFVLAWWRTAGDQINWRRFFDVTELAALRIEVPEVFEAVHAKTFELYEQGLIDGVRVDHVDGLTDPAGYCRTLRGRLDDIRKSRAATSPAYILVEKILAPNEALPKEWLVDGTTGYDFMNQVSALQHDPAGQEVLTGLWAELSGRTPDFEAEELAAREEMLRTGFDYQLAATAAAFYELAQSVGSRDLTEQSISRALIHIIRHMRVYRTYATGMPGSPPPGHAFDAAMKAAREEAPAEVLALDFVAKSLSADDANKAVRRFNQLTAPVAAKAVEDTAFYRYGRLLSRNDVGFDPGRLALPTADFHDDVVQRVLSYPNAMLTTATHDHKRGEDVRARLAVLSEIASSWHAEVERWFSLNAAIRPPGLAADEEYQLYQTLVGIWPIADAELGQKDFMSLRERACEWRVKSLREAKLRSSWAQPDADYEAANIGFIEAALDPSQSAPFLARLQKFADMIAPAGALNGLVQMILRLTLPGVPDMFQGTEFWDLSLVDPDNRRPVDFAQRIDTLEDSGPRNVTNLPWRDGQMKQRVAGKLLKLRREEPKLFSEGDYRPLTIDGDRKNNVIAFARRHDRTELIVALPIRCAESVLGSDRIAPPAEWWGDTHVKFMKSQAEMTDIFTGNQVRPSAQLLLIQAGELPGLVLLRKVQDGG